MRAVLVIILGVLLVASVTAEPKSIPVEDLKIYEFIELWDATPKDALTYGNTPVSSFRQAEYSYAQQKGYSFAPDVEEAKSFSSFARAKEYAPAEDGTQYAGTNSLLYLWSVHFANAKYPNYNTDITRIDIHIPKIESDDPLANELVTLTYLPVDDGLISIVSGEAIIVRDKLGAVVVVFGQDKIVQLYAQAEVSSEMADSIKQASFIALPQPEPVEVVQAQPVVVSPTPAVEETDAATSIVSIVFLILLVAGGAAGAIIFLRVRKKQAIVAQYSTPSGTPEVHKSHHSFMTHIHDITHKLRKHKQ